MNNDWDWTKLKAKCGNRLCNELPCYEEQIRKELALAEKRGAEKAVEYIKGNAHIGNYIESEGGPVLWIEYTVRGDILEQAKSL